MKRIIVPVLLMFLTIATAASAGSYNYVDPEDFKSWIETGKKVRIVDIQVPAEFLKHHFKGALETNAYPVKSAEEKQRLDQVLPLLASGNEEIVIVCPKGGGGAKNAYDHLRERGIPDDRLYVLMDGMKGWPYKELVATGK